MAFRIQEASLADHKEAAVVSNRYFDKQDREILELVKVILSSPVRDDSHIFNGDLHPHGIKNLSMSRITRVTYAVVNLLTSLDVGQTSDRIMALQVLYEEVLSSAKSTLRRNTARVLLQIMKDLVRANDDPVKQLMLAHDFRRTAEGTPRIVRAMLARYHLPEMPEDWNQLSFDGHVYDAHSRGRKTPTHLIMDAWIKGLRLLTVVYDNYIDISAAGELLEAAAVMDVQIRIGLEVHCPFRGRYVNMVWIPRGFSAADDFLEFLQTEKMRGLAERGKEIVEWRRGHVIEALEDWNARKRPELEQAWETTIPTLDVKRLSSCFGLGQPSFRHLSECIHQHLLPFILERADQLRHAPEEDAGALRELERLDGLNADYIAREWIRQPYLPDISAGIDPGLPEMLRTPPNQMVEELTDLHTGSRVCLDLAGLTVSDVLELIYDCGCGITHLEMFNLSNWYAGKLKDLPAINELQRILNEGLGPRIKQLTHEIIDTLDRQNDAERAEKFREILNSIPTIWEYYRKNPLKTRIGSHSSLETGYSVGMGFVYTETLPARSKKTLRLNSEYMGDIPVRTALEEHIAYSEDREGDGELVKFLRRIPGFGNLGKKKTRTWKAADTSDIAPAGNIAILGGITHPAPNGILASPDRERKKPDVFYLSTTLTNWIKVLAGFLPSVASFLYTQDWWFLAWFGTLIWFGITGIRNIIQMVVAGNGTTRSTLLRWKDHISVSRICDSLMYTGISVALLEVVVRVWLLEDLMGYTVSQDPLIVFTVLNFVNAIYICSHNIFRGFPREAAIGNLFRSALAIPVSSWYNQIFIWILLACGVQDPLIYTVPSAAIISKLASDTVAAVIEGYADSQNNRRIRLLDYKRKISQIFSCYTRIELLFPEKDVLEKLAHSGGFSGEHKEEARRLEISIIRSSLDLMYFWFYLPRSQDAFRQLLRNMSPADRSVFAGAQLILLRERDISQLLVNGLIGDNFARPLAFYLDKKREYLHELLRLCRSGRKTGGETQG